jgi:DNA-damage-inducible protein J
MASINMSIRTDSELKAQAEAVLNQLGMNMNGTINMFLRQIVRDKAVPLSLSLNSEQAVYADLLAAQTERASGYEGRNARAVLVDMDEIIAAAEDQ